MVRERIRRAEQCSHEDCGARRFYLEEDGFTYCDQGHRQSERGTVVTNETGELVITGRKQRRVESEGESIATSRSGFTNAQAYEHYLLCLQLLLRHQIAWLIEAKDLPAEFELVVKDLWTLRVQHTGTGSRNQASVEDETRSQVFSSQSEVEASTDAEGALSSASKSQNHRGRSTVSVLDTIAIIHIGILILQLPVSTADLSQWISDGHLLYYYSIKAAPSDLRKRLPGDLQRLLSPERVLKGEDLQSAVCNTITRLSGKFGICIPAINHILLLYRWIQLLALPLDIFAAVRRLSQLLEINFEHISARSSVARMPELRLMALIVVATKLLFPVDDVDRHSISTEGLAALAMNWDAWAKQMTSASHADSADQQLRYQDALTITESDCLELGEAQLDQYLDWYQENVASEHISERGRASRDANLRRAMLEMFPVGNSRSKTSTITREAEEQEAVKIAEQLRSTQRELTPRVNFNDQQEARAASAASEVGHKMGTYYRRYRRMDDLVVEPLAMRKLYELAAHHAAVSVEMMMRGVLTIENQLQKKEEEIARREQ